MRHDEIHLALEIDAKRFEVIHAFFLHHERSAELCESRAHFECGSIFLVGNELGLDIEARVGVNFRASWAVGTTLIRRLQLAGRRDVHIEAVPVSFHDLDLRAARAFACHIRFSALCRSCDEVKA